MAYSLMHLFGPLFSSHPCISTFLQQARSTSRLLPADFLVGVVVGVRSVASHLEGAEASKKKRSKYQKATMFLWSLK